MKKISSEEVASVLLDFSQLLQASTANSTSNQDWLFKRLSSGKPMAIKEALNLSDQQKAIFGEMLKQYIMFLTMFSDLTFPPNFLSGSSPTVLGSRVLSYMYEHQWPFQAPSAH